MSVSMHLDGAARLEQQLVALGKKAAGKVMRPATRAGAKAILPVAKANAQAMIGGEMGGIIADSLTVRVLKSGQRRRNEVGHQVVISQKHEEQLVVISKAGRRNYIPAAIEFGHDEAAPIPFMRAAYDSTARKALGVIMKQAGLRIEIEARKAT